MKLELHRNVDGSGLAISVTSDRAQRQIVIPLSQQLSGELDLMLKQEGIGVEKLILPPKLARH